MIVLLVFVVYLGCYVAFVHVVLPHGAVARPVPVEVPSARPGDDVIGTVDEPGWTALDDHQLDRLLRDSW